MTNYFAVGLHALIHVLFQTGHISGIVHKKFIEGLFQ